MKETWVTENQCLVSQDDLGLDLAIIKAAGESGEIDISEYEERVQAIVAGAMEVEAGKYVLRIWNYLGSQPEPSSQL